MIRKLLLACWALWLSLLPSAEAAWPVQYDIHFRRWGTFYAPDIDWKWWKAQGICESGLNPMARGPAGDAGIMQLIPATAAAMGVSNVYDPESNIAGGIKFSAQLWRMWAAIPDPAERRRVMFGSYNAGPGNIWQARKLAGGATTWSAISARLAQVTGRWSATTLAYVDHIHHAYSEIAR